MNFFIACINSSMPPTVSQLSTGEISMKTLLKITAGLAGTQGQSAQLADEYVRTWLAQNPGGRVITRDLSKQPVPHLTAERFEAFDTPEASRNASQHEIVSYSDVLIGELKSADTVVFAVPMYNF